MRDLTALPKAHLHVHLESTIRESTLTELAGEQPTPRQRGPFNDFAAFAEAGGAVRDLLLTPEQFRRIAAEFCADQAADGVRYAEVTFTAASHEERIGEPLMPLRAVVEGLEEGMRANDISVRLILDHPRRRSVRRWARTAELARVFADQVVAIGLAGAENHPVEPFAELCRVAESDGIGLVHHAGEFGGPDSIRAVLDHGRAHRIGHAITALAEPNLVARLRDEGIGIEVCPTSNVTLGVVDSLSAHPFPRMVDAGLRVGVHTDIPAATGATLTQEFETLRQVFGCTDSEIANFAWESVDMSYAPEPTKTRIRAGIDRWAS